MKRLYLLLLLIGSYPLTMLAQSPAERIGQLKQVFEQVDIQANELSRSISDISSESIFEETQWINLRAKLTLLDAQIRRVKNSDFRTRLRSYELRAYNAHLKDFDSRSKLMRTSINYFEDFVNEKLYQGQLSFTSSQVAAFITATANFKQFVISLMPVVPDNLLTKIKERIGETDKLISVGNDSGKAVSQYVRKAIPQLGKDVNGVHNDTQDILKLLQPKPTAGIKALIAASAYSDAVFGTAFFEKLRSSSFAGLEFIFPVHSAVVHNPGGFAYYGISGNGFFAQAGIGYLKSDKVRDNISWKAGALYKPAKVGFGLSYSPLTGAGLQLGISW